MYWTLPTFDILLSVHLWDGENMISIWKAIPVVATIPADWNYLLCISDCWAARKTWRHLKLWNMDARKASTCVSNVHLIFSVVRCRRPRRCSLSRGDTVLLEKISFQTLKFDIDWHISILIGCTLERWSTKELARAQCTQPFRPHMNTIRYDLLYYYLNKLLNINSQFLWNCSRNR